MRSCVCVNVWEFVQVAYVCRNNYTASGDTYGVDEEINDADEVTDECLWCEEETIGQNLEAHLDAHTHHKCILSYL